MPLEHNFFRAECFMEFNIAAVPGWLSYMLSLASFRHAPRVV
jgi:hypothetical protein